ncbi:DNA-binding protein HEXBP-like [Helianthus annuus]|uniref:DNA-binding protein HEXBP-like n=1 Tax=Helianthus annuus TaxID=4232 RepID=UPI000B8FA3F3|nr:DNA-binding protein HEXBP-like [Helianthus annuus]
MSPHRSDTQRSELTATIAQQLSIVLYGTIKLAVAMSHLKNETTQGALKKTKTKPSRKSKKCKASQNFVRVAQNNQAAPNQPAQPPAKKPYAGTAPLCNRCNAHHQAHLQCRQCTSCGRLGHLASACRTIPSQGGPNQPQANPAQAHFPPGSCYNCGEMGHFRNDCPNLVNANLAHG